MPVRQIGKWHLIPPKLFDNQTGFLFAKLLGGITSEVEPMPLTLLFSRQRNTDESVRFTDVEIESASIMVDALSFLSRFKRSAGWLYPIRRSGPSDYERGEGQLILFGKTRVVFDDFPTPYYLEFFPRYGVSNFILSFYSGVYDTPDESGFVNVPPGVWYVDFDPGTGAVRSRFGPPGSETYPLASNAIDAFILGSVVWSRLVSGYCSGFNLYTSVGEVVSVEDYLTLRSDPSAIILS